MSAIWRSSTSVGTRQYFSIGCFLPEPNVPTSVSLLNCDHPLALPPQAVPSWPLLWLSRDYDNKTSPGPWGHSGGRITVLPEPKGIQEPLQNQRTALGRLHLRVRDRRSPLLLCPLAGRLKTKISSQLNTLVLVRKLSSLTSLTSPG